MTAHYKKNSRIHEDLNKIEKCILIDEILKYGNKDIEKMQKLKFEKLQSEKNSNKNPF